MFEDIQLGDFLAVRDISPKRLRQHYESLLDMGLFAVALATGDKNECVIAFKNDKEFATRGVFINFYYIKQYDA